MITPGNLEFALAFLIESSRITVTRPICRLNGIEMLVAASRRWRDRRPLLPEYELRIAADTSRTLLEWVGADDEDSMTLRARSRLT